MKNTIALKGLVIVFWIAVLPHLAFASKPSCTKMNFSRFYQIAADTTSPAKDNASTVNEEKTGAAKQDNTNGNEQVQVVKVIPKARKQPVPVPVKVNVHAVKVIKPKIIKPVVKPLIKIFH